MTKPRILVVYKTDHGLLDTSLTEAEDVDICSDHIAIRTGGFTEEFHSHRSSGWK